MSKPDKPGELQDVEVQAISMVSKAANGEKFKIFKSVDDEPEPEIEDEKVPEVVKEEKGERGLFSILKDFFTGGDKVEKDELIDTKSEIEKAGRKISGSNLGKLKNIQSLLADVLSGLDDAENASKETEELTKEEIQKEVAEAVKAVNIKNIVKEILTPINERIEKIENARGVSNRVVEESAVEKGTDNFWGGIF